MDTEAGDAVEMLFIKSGQWAVARPGTEIRTDLGSCVALCLWDPAHHLGGMNHYVLPGSDTDLAPDGNSGRYANEVLLRQMLQAGASLRGLQGAIIGGGSLSPQGDPFQIGCSNAAEAQRLLAAYGIPLRYRRVGGPISRHVALDAGRGLLSIKEIRMGTGRVHRYDHRFDPSPGKGIL